MKYNINNGLSCHRHSLSKISLPEWWIQELTPSYAEVYRKHWWIQGRLFSPSGLSGSRCLTISWGHLRILARPPTTELLPVCELDGTVSCQTSFMQVKHVGGGGNGGCAANVPLGIGLGMNSTLTLDMFLPFKRSGQWEIVVLYVGDQCRLEIWGESVSQAW